MKNYFKILALYIFFFSCKEEKINTCYKPTEYSWKGVNDLVDLDSARAYAKCVNKPLLVFFTGWACVSNRKMEEKILSSFLIKRKLNNDYVLVSLYVDDQEPIKEEFYSGYLKRVAKTVGDKYFDYQLSKFNSASQPYFAILDTNQNILGTFPYTPDIAKVKTHLDKAYTLFQRQQ